MHPPDWHSFGKQLCRGSMRRRIPCFLLSLQLLGVAGAVAAPLVLVSPVEEEGGWFGYSVSAVPDANGDGWVDVAVGAIQEDPGASPESAGRVHLFSGSDGTWLRTLVSPNQEIGGSFGVSVSGVPDVNGDGRGDAIVGSTDDPDPSPTNAGRAYVFSGSDGTLLWTLVSPNEEFKGFFGESVSGIPDVNGDDRGDVVVGAKQEDPDTSPDDAGRAYIFSGSDGTLLWTLVSPNQETMGWFGASVSGMPDANGDGRGDVLVGAKQEDPGTSPDNAGRAYIFSGSDGTLLATLCSPNEESTGSFGNSLAGIPDANGDGRGDAVVGAMFEDPGGSPGAAGRAYVFSGSDGTLIATLVSPNEELSGFFGCAVSGANDVNADGRGDVVVGAYGEDPGGSPETAGRAYVFSGSDGTAISTLVSPNEDLSGFFGYSVSGPLAANGNARSDAIVGAYGEDPGGSPEKAGRVYGFVLQDIAVLEPEGVLDFGNRDVSAGPTGSRVVRIRNVRGRPPSRFCWTGIDDPGTGCRRVSFHGFTRFVVSSIGGDPDFPDRFRPIVGRDEVRHSDPHDQRPRPAGGGDRALRWFWRPYHNSDCNRHADGDEHTDRHSHRHGYPDSHADAHPERYSHRNPHGNPDPDQRLAFSSPPAFPPSGRRAACRGSRGIRVRPGWRTRSPGVDVDRPVGGGCKRRACRTVGSRGHDSSLRRPWDLSAGIPGPGRRRRCRLRQWGSRCVDPYPNLHTHTAANSNDHLHVHSDFDRHEFRHAHRHPNADPYANAHGYLNADLDMDAVADGDRDSHFNGNPQPDGDGDSFFHTEPLGGLGCERRRSCRPARHPRDPALVEAVGAVTSGARTFLSERGHSCPQ